MCEADRMISRTTGLPLALALVGTLALSACSGGGEKKVTDDQTPEEVLDSADELEEVVDDPTDLVEVSDDIIFDDTAHDEGNPDDVLIDFGDDEK